jgi:hypothetical protein
MKPSTLNFPRSSEGAEIPAVFAGKIITDLRYNPAIEVPMARPRWRYRFTYSSMLFIAAGFIIALIFPFWSKGTLISAIVVGIAAGITVADREQTARLAVGSFCLRRLNVRPLFESAKVRFSLPGFTDPLLILEDSQLCHRIGDDNRVIRRSPETHFSVFRR